MEPASARRDGATHKRAYRSRPLQNVPASGRTDAYGDARARRTYVPARQDRRKKRTRSRASRHNSIRLIRSAAPLAGWPRRRRSSQPGLKGSPPPPGAPDYPGLEVAGEIIALRSEEHTSELQSLMRISYAVFCLKKKNKRI